MLSICAEIQKQGKKKRPPKITTHLSKVLKSKCHFRTAYQRKGMICINHGTLLTGNTTPAFPSYHHKSNICSFYYNPVIITLFYSEFSYAPLAARKFQILFCKTCSCGSYCLPILDDVLPCVWTADSVK